MVSVAKGIENDTLLTMTEVLEQCLPEEYHPHIAVLSGPSFAKEMVRRLPTVVTIASRFETTARTRAGDVQERGLPHLHLDRRGGRAGAAARSRT